MIRLQSLSKSYGSKNLFKEISYQFPLSGRVALVGPNGVGKSTLLKIITGEEECDKGEVVLPGAVTMGYLPQEPNAKPLPTVLEESVSGSLKLKAIKAKLDDITEKMSSAYSELVHAQFERLEEEYRINGGYALDSRAKGILVGLGFSPDWFSKSPLSLSGGWRMRLELAKVFLNDPDFLILDEPTNHLDLPSLAWVERYLLVFEGTVLFVSHDKSLLNKLSNFTLHLHKGKLTQYKGNFDKFLEERAIRQEQEAQSAEQLRKKKEALEKFITRFGAKASKAAQAQSRVKMLERLSSLENEDGTADMESMVLNLPEPIKSGREVCKIENGAIGYTTPLSKNIQFKIERGQKIAIIGANGIGKSTLLKTLVGLVPKLNGNFEFGHNVIPALFAQDQLDTLDEQKTALENVLNSSPDVSERQARSLLGSFLFRGDDVFKPVSVLSGGEKSRVGLACLLCQKANFLILDEPTNHLDMSSCEILAAALQDYEGTALFVSHDRTFIDEVCTHVFAMLADGRSALFEGKLDDYKRLAKVAGFPNVLDAEEGPIQTNSEIITAALHFKKNTSEVKRELTRLERRSQDLEKTISKHSANIKTLNDFLISEEASDYQKSKEWQTSLTDSVQNLSVAENEWFDVLNQISLLEEELSTLQVK